MRQEEVIREVTDRLGITLVELGRRAGITPGYLQDLMHGRALPSLGTCRRLTLASGGRITFDEILSWERQGDGPGEAG